MKDHLVVHCVSASESTGKEEFMLEVFSASPEKNLGNRPIRRIGTFEELIDFLENLA